MLLASLLRRISPVALAVVGLGCAGCPGRRSPASIESFPLDSGFDPTRHRWRGLVADGDDLLFGTLDAVSRRGGATRSAGKGGVCSGRSTVAVTPRWRYWSCEDGGAPLGKLVRVAKAPGDGEDAEVVVPAYFSAASMAGDGDGLWFAGSVGRTPAGIAVRAGLFHLADDATGAGGLELVKQDSEAALEGARIQTDASAIYWIRYGMFAREPATVLATDKRGGATRTLSTQERDVPTAIALSPTHVFFGGTAPEGTGLVRIPKSGGRLELVAGKRAGGAGANLRTPSAYEGIVVAERYAYWVTGCSGHFLHGIECTQSAVGRAELRTGAVDVFAAPFEVAGPALSDGWVTWAEQPKARAPWSLRRVRAE